MEFREFPAGFHRQTAVEFQGVPGVPGVPVGSLGSGLDRISTN